MAGKAFSTFSASAGVPKVTRTSVSTMLRASGYNPQTMRPLVEAGETFVGAGTAGYEDMAAAQKDAMKKAEQTVEPPSIFSMIPTWAWIAGAAGIVFLVMRGRGGSQQRSVFGGGGQVG